MPSDSTNVLTAARVEALQASYDRVAADPRRFAADLLDRLADRQLIDVQWTDDVVQRKIRNLANAFGLVVRNADLIHTITGVMTKTAMPTLGVSASPAHGETIRAELLAGVEAADNADWSATLRGDWAGVVSVVADATFGPVRVVAA